MQKFITFVLALLICVGGAAAWALYAIVGLTPAKKPVEVVKPSVQIQLKDRQNERAIPRSFSPDGRWIYLKGRRTGEDELIGLPNGPRIQLDSYYVPLQAFSPDGRWFVGQRQKYWCLWDLSDGASERKLCPYWRVFQKGKNIYNIGDNSRSVHFSPDSQKVAIFWWATSHDEFPNLYFWDVQTGKQDSSFAHRDLFGKRPERYSVAAGGWCAERTFVVVKSKLDDNPGNPKILGHSLCVFDLKAAKTRFEIENVVTGQYPHPTWRLSPDGKRCVAIVAEKTVPRPGLPNPYFKADNEVNVPQDPAVQLWNTETGKLIWQRPFPSDHAFFHLSFMPDGNKVAIGSRNLAKNNQSELHLWHVVDGASHKLIHKQTKGPRGEFSLTATGRYLQYDDPPWAGNTPLPGGAEPQIVGGWWTIDKNEAMPSITFDDNGNWYDAAGKKHVLFTDAEKRQERKEGQRRANLRSMQAQNAIAIPGALANLSPDDRWLAMRLTFLEPIIEPMRIGSNRQRDTWNHELHLIDLRDGSKSPIIYNAEHWLFSPDGKTLATTGDGNLRVWKLPLN